MTSWNATKRLARVPTTLTMLALGAPLLAGCLSGGPASVEGLRPIVGTKLIGAHGRTAADQEKIDSTVARLCGGKVFTTAECARHGEALRGDPS